jgi:hypothetical protein
MQRDDFQPRSKLLEMAPDCHPAALPLDVLRNQCSVERVRRSGPGGQHRNKVETGIVIRHIPSGVRAEASERRSQSENLAVAWQRLRVCLAIVIRTEPIAVKPTALWQLRISEGTMQVNQRHPDYPTLLAEALDILASFNWDIAVAAERLSVSRSQLTKFLRREAEAMAIVNLQRSVRGLRRLV